MRTKVFPVDGASSTPKVPPGSDVAIRGFALTMIDASLALTEGRGAVRPGASLICLEYEQAADEVAGILPWSRTGRPMLAKPDPTQGIGSVGSGGDRGRGPRSTRRASRLAAPSCPSRAIVLEVAGRACGVGPASGRPHRWRSRPGRPAGRASPRIFPRRGDRAVNRCSLGEPRRAPLGVGHTWRALPRPRRTPRRERSR